MTSSPRLPRARLQRAFFDGSQHAPLPPGPSARRVRAEPVGLGLRLSVRAGPHVPRPPSFRLSTPPHDLPVFKAPLSDLSPQHLFVCVLTEGSASPTDPGWCGWSGGRGERTPRRRLLGAEERVPRSLGPGPWPRASLACLALLFSCGHKPGPALSEAWVGVGKS